MKCVYVYNDEFLRKESMSCWMKELKSQIVESLTEKMVLWRHKIINTIIHQIDQFIGDHHGEWWVNT